MKKKTFKILITGIHYLHCNGETAILIGLISSLEKRFPDAHFYIGSIGGKFDGLQSSRVFPDIINKLHLIRVPALKGLHWTLRVLMLFVRYFFTYPKCDVVIHIGTDGYSNKILPSKLLSWLSVLGHSYQLMLGHFWGKPVIGASMTIGPFEGIFSKWIAKTTLNQVDLLTVREDSSLSYLKQLGIKCPMYLVGDLAFLMEPVDKNKMASLLLKNNQISSERHLAIVVPNLIQQQISARSTRDWKSNPYLRFMADLVDYLHRIGLQVILLAQTTGFKHNDVITCQHIQQLSKVSPPIVDNTKYTPQETKGIMQLCDIVISGKLHATIFAVSAAVPAIAIMSQHKVRAIIGDMLGMHDSIVEFNKLDTSITMQQLVKKVSEFIHGNDKIRHDLRQKIPDMRKEAFKNIELIAGIINNKNI